jgi:hypothetical protein
MVLPSMVTAAKIFRFRNATSTSGTWAIGFSDRSALIGAHELTPLVPGATQRATQGIGPEGDLGRFATLREKFANWFAMSNRNRRLALALILLHAVLRSLEYLVGPWKEGDP